MLQEVVEVLQYAVEQKEAYQELVDELKAELGDACTELDDVRQEHQVNEILNLPNWSRKHDYWSISNILCDSSIRQHIKIEKKTRHFSTFVHHINF